MVLLKKSLRTVAASLVVRDRAQLKLYCKGTRHRRKGGGS